MVCVCVCVCGLVFLLFLSCVFVCVCVFVLCVLCFSSLAWSGSLCFCPLSGLCVVVILFVVFALGV